ncbi:MULTISPECIES: patatin-like phospholipase family protein [unclassified Stappia]|uniref:patatin-like phospholipase family protein n=1 Tax=unclassified Stappia TaxID=2629676 RepID=UPI001643794F|nr:MULTISPECIES: patatin-like phospholipase family protein [unclassified Stappia]
MTTVRIGLALGGGGARGMAHVPVMEAFDDLGIRPAAIAGTSIGAIFGAAFATGLDGAALREISQATFADRNAVLARLWKLRPRRLGDLFGNPGIMQFNALKVLEQFVGQHIPASFEELQTPLTLIATDFYLCREVRLQQGSLHHAVAASIAIPALFKPVTVEGRIMVDGGLVNPLPFDALPPDMDIVVASDVVGSPIPRKGRNLPGAGDAVFGATQILMQSIVQEKLKNRQPDVLVKPDISGFRVLDFMKTGTILEAAEPMRETVKRQVAAAIEAFEAGRAIP